MARYEATDSISRKFWTIDVLDGLSFRTLHGRVGAEPRETIKSFATAAEAERAAAKAIAARVKAGYAEVAVRKVAVPSAALEELEVRIAEEPDDLSACGVYGDWLQEREDPFGEILALHVAVAEEKDPSRRGALMKELETARRAAPLFGPVALHARRLELTWHHGILQEVRIRTGPPERGVSVAALLGMMFALPVARFVSRLAFPALNASAFGSSPRRRT
jgi:uncharacterized protein (TIGR02996 family)